MQTLNIFYTIVLLLLLLNCSGKSVATDDSQKLNNAVENADKAFQSLISIYWDAHRNIFYSSNTKNTGLNYWWQAHGLNALVDAAEREGNDSLFTMISDFYNGIGNANNGFINDYYDDMAWMGIALIRAYVLTGTRKYLDTSILLWHDISTGWNETNGGGIAWNKNMLTYKNTPSNATTAILSFRLYTITGEKKYFDLGEKIMLWLQSTLIDESSGMVWDGIGRTGAGIIDYNWLFTYNQGIYIGACVEFYPISDDELWRERAIKTADNALLAFNGNLNILKDEGSGDGGLFKGILIRYLKSLYDQAYLDQAKKDTYKEYLRKNADVLWKYGKSSSYPYLFNHDWTAPPSGENDLSVQLSGVFLMEACAGF